MSERMMGERAQGETICRRDAQLRAWFVRDCDPVWHVIDGLDIGWGDLAYCYERILDPPPVWWTVG